ncbi:MAG: lasso RiPP family leader peptide-containing protein [Anaerolineae bacterium]|nr:lasso RiPP family leader peptide-containing protein [Anaerolineae bacterium]
MNQRVEQKLATGKATSVTASRDRVLKPYAPPRLQLLGDIRDLTMGGSPGIGDSGVEEPEFPQGWPG